MSFSQLIKAAFKKAERTRIEALLPASPSVTFAGLRLERSYMWNDIVSRVKTFNQMHDWQENTLHPCFLQVLGLELQLGCLLDKSFPFPVMGLVHIANQVQIVSPLHPADYSLRAEISALKRHEKGAVVSVNITASSEGKEVYSATSDYLYRMASSRPTSNRDDRPSVMGLGTKLLDISLAKNAGRRYAKLSRDYNPIHLWSITAKVLGFKQPIAHGMHTLSLCMSALSKNAGPQHSLNRIENRFIAPAPLPCQVSLYTREFELGRDGEHPFLLVNRQDVVADNALAESKRPIIDGTFQFESLG
ncbi:MaoC/PaaZ C-terminal domain-containing protein [Alteromonas facilis]|uniref:MaoC/PaaZ C-terminal domain-containing protein n=1 Tax=Alteromonas facilis TaxID=2048004 RepID=UPI000C281BE1|nr:MaoC/PaaZ C-terminal domain-containing protein [Alteromonas facilis]